MPASSEDELDVPTVSMDDLVGPSKAAAARVLFPRCAAMPTEVASCEAHLRRCLRCPVTVSPIPHEAREELLSAVLYELHCGGSFEPLGAPLRPALALQLALRDVEAHAAASRAAEARAHGGPRMAGAERGRWQRKERGFEDLAERLRAELGEASATAAAEAADAAEADEAEPAAGRGVPPDDAASDTSERSHASKAASVGVGAAGGKKLAVRSLSFSKALRRGSRAVKPPAAADGGGSATGGGAASSCGNGSGDCAANGGGGASSGSKVKRSKSFDRLKRAAKAMRHPMGSHTGTPSSTPPPTPPKPAVNGGAAAAEQIAAPRSRNKLAMLRAATGSPATRSEPPTHGNLRRLTQPPPAALRALMEPSAGSASGSALAGMAPAGLRDALSEEPRADLRELGRDHELLLFGLVSAWQRRAATNGAPEDETYPPFPVDEDGALLLRGGASGWVLDEFSAHFGISPLSRTLGLLSVVLEGCMQADDGGEGRGAPPELLTLAIDTFSTALRALHSEEVGAALPSSAAQLVGTDGPAGSAAPGKMRRAALAVAAQPGRLSMALGRVGGQRAPEPKEALERVEEEEHGCVCFGRADLPLYSKCVNTLWRYVGMRLPEMIAERDEQLAEAEAEAEYGELGHSACAGLLIHLLSLSHRLGPTTDEEDSSSEAEEEEEEEEQELAERSHAVEYIWQEQLCPATLAASARSALRAAATLQCAQEMRAARQTVRCSTHRGQPAGKGDRGGGMLPKIQGMLHAADGPSDEAAEWRSAVWVELVRLRRLRQRLQRSLPLHLQLLSTVVGGGRGVLLVWGEVLCDAVIDPLQELCMQVPVDAATTDYVLNLCLEHRRVEALLSAAKRSLDEQDAQTRARAQAEAGSEGDDALARSASGRNAQVGVSEPPLAADGDPEAVPIWAGLSVKSSRLSAEVNMANAGAPAPARNSVNTASEERLTEVAQRSWYSPFVFRWVEQACEELRAWLRTALDEEDWHPMGADKVSRTLRVLFYACGTMVRSLGMLGVNVCGEAISAAGMISDLVDAFAARLAAAADFESRGIGGEGDGLGGGERGRERTIDTTKAVVCGACTLLTHTGLFGDEVVLTYVEPSKALSALLRAGEVVLSVNGERVSDAMRAVTLLRASSDIRLRVRTPPALLSARHVASLRQSRAKLRVVRANRAREMLANLTLEAQAPANDPLLAEAGRGGGDGAGGDGANGGDGGGEGGAEAGKAAGGGEGGIDALEEELAEEEDEEDEEQHGLIVADDESPGGEWASGKEREVCRRCLLLSNAWAARGLLEDLVSGLEGALAASPEQQAIVAEGFSPVFRSLRAVSDGELACLVADLLAPAKSHMAACCSQLASPLVPSHAEPPAANAASHAGAPEAAGGAGAGGMHGSRPVRTLAELGRWYPPTLAWMRRWLAPEALQRLLQRLWTELIAELSRGLRQHLCVPRAIGGVFASAALSLLRTLPPLLLCEGDGPSESWMRRRSAGLRGTLQLAELSTPDLLCQYRAQPAGPKRTAPLVALAMRMDDADAVGLIASDPPPPELDSELLAPSAGGDAADAKPLAVDGVAALEGAGVAQRPATM